MKTNLHKWLLLSMAMLAPAIARADWFYDFNDGVIPDTLETFGWLPGTPPTIYSSTFQSSAEGGYLRMWDDALLSPNNGGTLEGDAMNEEVFTGNVRVTAVINPAGTTDDWMGLLARDTIYFQNYHMGFSFGGTHAGRLFVAKGLPGGSTEILISSARLSDLDRSYFMELEVIDDPISKYPVVTGRLFDYEGGEKFLQMSFTDNWFGGSQPYTSGRAAVWAVAFDYNVLDATFDNISAVSLSSEADFDGDGDVDGTDFLVWQRGESPNPMSEEDLAAWQAQFGTVGTPSSLAVVPEPSTLSLISFFTLTALAFASSIIIQPRCS